MIYATFFDKLKRSCRRCGHRVLLQLIQFVPQEVNAAL